MKDFSEITQKIIASGIEINYLPTEYIFRLGQKAEFVFYMMSGTIMLTYSDNQSHTLSNKQLFLGLHEAFDSLRHQFSAQIMEPSKFLVFDKKYFLMLLQEFDVDQTFFNQQIQDFELYQQLIH
ncbi:cyclic nucleotide-binding domain-containing protein [Aquirufa sp. ROCK-SH2]